MSSRTARDAKGKTEQKKLKLSKETLKDLGPGGRKAGDVRGGKPCSVGASGCGDT